mgnify:CR=1 FL=1
MPKKKPLSFDSIWGFDEIDGMMERFKMMDHFMSEALEQLEGREGPVFYGFSISIDNEGKPIVNEFGNVKPGLKGPELAEEIEPLVDVIDSKDAVKIYAELPGVEKGDIDLSATESSLTISVHGEKKRYHKEVDLPQKVNPDTAKATYKNGVLEVCVGKVVKRRGKQLKVE